MQVKQVTLTVTTFVKVDDNSTTKQTIDISSRQIMIGAGSLNIDTSKAIVKHDAIQTAIGNHATLFEE